MVANTSKALPEPVSFVQSNKPSGFDRMAKQEYKGGRGDSVVVSPLSGFISAVMTWQTKGVFRVTSALKRLTGCRPDLLCTADVLCTVCCVLCCFSTGISSAALGVGMLSTSDGGTTGVCH